MQPSVLEDYREPDTAEDSGEHKRLVQVRRILARSFLWVDKSIVVAPHHFPHKDCRSGEDLRTGVLDFELQSEVVLRPRNAQSSSKQQKNARNCAGRWKVLEISPNIGYCRISSSKYEGRIVVVTMRIGIDPVRQKIEILERSLQVFRVIKL